MPTKLARTVASSVWGLVSHRSSATITATAAPATIRVPSTRPATRRAPESARSARCAIGLHPEQRHPEDEGDENREARIDERSRAEERVHAHPEEDRAREQGDNDANRRAEHPRWEERADDVDLRSQDFSLPTRRGAGVRDVAHREREGRRRLQQLDLRVELDEPCTTQLTAGGEQVGQRAQPHAIRLERILVRLLRGLHQGGRDVEAPERQFDVGVRLPDFTDGAVACGRDLVLSGPTRRLGKLDLAATRSTIEDLPLERQADAVAGLGGSDPSG